MHFPSVAAWSSSHSVHRPTGLHSSTLILISICPSIIPHLIPLSLSPSCLTAESITGVFGAFCTTARNICLNATGPDCSRQRVWLASVITSHWHEESTAATPGSSPGCVQCVCLFERVAERRDKNKAKKTSITRSTPPTPRSSNTRTLTQTNTSVHPIHCGSFLHWLQRFAQAE
ncbi:hypothetical protein MHYP_G00144990 [Metynnis hypsauchen]